MRIAQLTSVYIPVPPPTHGGTELMVHALSEGLSARGHDVHLYASGDSRTAGTLHAVVARATLDDGSVTRYMDKELEARNTFELYRDADAYDVIHCHWPTLAAYFAPFVRTPTVMSYHYIEPAEHAYYRRAAPGLFPVCVSRAQARMLGEPTLPVVYNGLVMSSTPFVAEAGDYLALVARMAPTKGVAEAIRIAGRAGRAAGHRRCGHALPPVEPRLLRRAGAAAYRRRPRTAHSGSLERRGVGDNRPR